MPKATYMDWQKRFDRENPDKEREEKILKIAKTTKITVIVKVANITLTRVELALLHQTEYDDALIHIYLIRRLQQILLNSSIMKSMQKDI